MTLKKRIKRRIINLIMALSSIRKLKKQVLFSSFGGKRYSDNPRAVSEKLHELYPEIEQVWFLSNPQDYYQVVPDYFRVIRTSAEYYRELASSACLVTNEDLPYYITKRTGQFFIQTYHGDRGFKKILYEAWPDGKRPTPVMDEFYTDLCVAGSEFGASNYRDSFHYGGEILKKGCPRNDALVECDPNRAKDVRKKLQIDEEYKILLYAPTFRDSGKCNEGAVNVGEVLAKLNEKERWVCLTRLHPMDKNIGLMKNTAGCIDVTDYPDIADLLLVADLLITDHSSCAPDFVLTGRPVILAAFDRAEYSASSREFKVPLEAPGFLIANDQEQLMDLLNRLDSIDHKTIADKVLTYYGAFESGKSSETVCERIAGFLKKM